MQHSEIQPYLVDHSVKWDITPGITGLTLLALLISRVITDLPTGLKHQTVVKYFSA